MQTNRDVNTLLDAGNEFTCCFRHDETCHVFDTNRVTALAVELFCQVNEAGNGVDRACGI